MMVDRPSSSVHTVNSSGSNPAPVHNSCCTYCINDHCRCLLPITEGSPPSLSLRSPSATIISSLRRGTYLPQSRYPSLRLRALLLHDPALFKVGPSSISGAGLGLYVTCALPAHTNLGVYGGLVLSEPNSYSMEMWASGPMVGSPPDSSDPFSVFGYINDPLQPDRCNVTCRDGGLLVSLVPLSAGAELFMDYGPDYDWEYVRSSRLEAIRTFLIDSASLLTLNPDLALCTFPPSLTAVSRPTEEGGVPLLVHRILYPDPSHPDPYHWCHTYYPAHCDDPLQWLLRVLSCRPVVAQIGWRGTPIDRWLPLDGLVQPLPPLRSQRAAALAASCRLAASLPEEGSPVCLPRCADWSAILSSTLSPLVMGDTAKDLATDVPASTMEPDLSSLLPSPLDPTSRASFSSPNEVPPRPLSVIRSFLTPAKLPLQHGQWLRMLPQSLGLTDAPTSALRLVSYNVNTLSETKLKDLGLLFRSLDLDALILVDTRAPTELQKLFRSILFHLLPRGYSLHLVPPSPAVSTGVGGIVFITGPRLAQPQLMWTCPYGSIGILQFSFEGSLVRLMGIYSPVYNNAGGSLWKVLTTQSRFTPPSYILRILRGAATDSSVAATPLICCGDLNTSSRLVASSLRLHLPEVEAIGLTHSSSPKDLLRHSYVHGTHRSRLDYQLFQGRLTSVQCFPFELLSYPGDHLPLIGLYDFPVNVRTTRLVALPPFDIRLTDSPRCAAFKAALLAEPIPPQAPDELLSFLSEITVKTAHAIFKRKLHSQGWSPLCDILTLNLHMVVRLQRGVLGLGGRKRWPLSSFSAKRDRLVRRWRALIMQRARTPEQAAEWLNLHSGAFGMRYWGEVLMEDLTPALFRAALGTCQSRLHGRKRMEMRRASSARTRSIEVARAAGKIGPAIAAIFGQRRLGYRLESLLVDGVVEHDGNKIHTAVTSHFQDWFAAPPSAGSFPSLPIYSPDADWRLLVDSDEPAFVRQYAHLGIPPDLLTLLWKATRLLQPPIGLTDSLSLAPTWEEFNSAILHSAKDSSAGMSGLSYNMIKCWPTHFREAAYSALVSLWNSSGTPTQWKWRWLVPIPKVPDPSLQDLRPLCLNEALRKIWFSIVIRRLQRFWAAGGIRATQHGFVRGRSTDDPCLEIINALETARETRADLYVGSWDWRRAFDSPSRPLLIFSLVRMGIPSPLAEYIINQDMDGHTVVRSPLAQRAHQAHPYAGVLHLSFYAQRGTAQGDVTSPACWNAVYDILLTALELAAAETTAFSTMDARGYSLPVREAAYADDLFSLCGTHEAFQRSADIVSAFSLLTGMTIAVPKLRAFRLQWGNASLPGSDHFYMHERGWSPRLVLLPNNGSFKHLGIVHDLAGDGRSQFEELLAHVKASCESLRNARFNADTKWTALYTKVYRKILYSIRLAPWPLQWYEELERPISSLLRRITRNFPSFPQRLLYLPKKYGGLGFKSLVDLAQERKLVLLQKLSLGTPYQRHTASSLVSRPLRDSSAVPSGCPTLQVPLGAGTGCSFWASSLLEWLRSKGMTLRLAGSPGPATSLLPLIWAPDGLITGAAKRSALTNSLIALNALTIQELTPPVRSHIMGTYMDIRLPH